MLAYTAKQRTRSAPAQLLTACAVVQQESHRPRRVVSLLDIPEEASSVSLRVDLAFAARYQDHSQTLLPDICDMNWSPTRHSAISSTSLLGFPTLSICVPDRVERLLDFARPATLLPLYAVKSRRRRFMSTASPGIGSLGAKL